MVEEKRHPAEDKNQNNNRVTSYDGLFEEMAREVRLRLAR